MKKHYSSELNYRGEEVLSVLRGKELKLLERGVLVGHSLIIIFYLGSYFSKNKKITGRFPILGKIAHP